MSELSTTHELRWFTREVPDAALDVALDALGVRPWDDVSPDVHVYLRGGEPGLGVKWRDDALEVKQRLGVATGPVRVGPLAARPERWTKWRLDVPTITAPEPEAWVPVRKRRRLALVDACQLELTAFDAGGVAGHTLAFEAFEPEPLTALAARVGRMLADVDEGRWQAAGWPAWLASTR